MGADAGGEKAKKVHKKSQAGVKAKKKKDKKAEGAKVERHNPKAHSFSGGVQSVRKRVQYQLDKAVKKEHVKKVDKAPEVPPPFVIVVQGPPGVGKSTLVKSLVRHYCKQQLIKMQGPVTLVSGRQRRITIVECPQDMASMLDLAKVADLCLLLIDASFGFELETFEFINILQVHGFPRVIGVLTHLDAFRENKQLRKAKKTMKSRFWTEIYEGSKLFYLSGLQYGRYNRLETQNLARFIAVQKVPLLSWRQAHPYTLALRWEDQTPPDVPKEEPRTLDVYGYVYGGRLREGSQVHLAGAGDFRISAVKALADPCPVPKDVEAERRAAAPGGKEDKKKPKRANALRTLAERHRVVYAPGSDVGSIMMDEDAMYIQVPDHAVGFTERDDERTGRGGVPEAVRLVRELQQGASTLDAASASRPGLRLVGRQLAQLADDDAIEDGDDGANADSPTERARRPARRLAPTGEVTIDKRAQKERTGVDGGEEADSDSEDGESETEGSGAEDPADSEEEHRQDVLEKARARFQQAPKLEALVYGTASLPNASVPAAPAVSATDHKTVQLFDDDGDDDAAARGPAARSAGGGLFGNLGDLDADDSNRMPVLPGERDDLTEERKEALKTRRFITGGWSSAEEDEAEEAEDGEAEEAEDGEKAAAVGDAGGGRKKKAIVESKTAALEDFADGVPIASFVRIRLDGVPAAIVAEMKRERPLLLGGLLPGEDRLGMTQVRVKRHRWHPKLLKSNDVLILSVGWRRFQTLPTFCLEDRGEKRMRYLKYTLEHAHCVMTTYGPMAPPNTGVVAFRSWKGVGHFRIAATGGVLETAPSFEVKKKLKLTGEPYKVFKNTAFIRGMFNSDLEVSKYLHTKLQTVSGIRGEVKKPEGTRGNFRATFEDRILMSDIVVCKCWINTEPKRFYHPVVDVERFKFAGLIGELRATKGVPVPVKQDSNYGKQITRAERKFNKLRIPKNLEMSLPFKTKPKNDKKASGNVMNKKTAVIRSEREKSVSSLISRLYTVQKAKRKLRGEQSTKKKVTKEKREKWIQDKREAYAKDNKKKRYVKEGMEETKKRKAMRLE